MLVDALCKEGKAAEAEDIISSMIQSCVKPDIATYNTLIDGYCLLGKLTKAREIFNSMVGKDLDIATYNTLIDGYCLLGKLRKAREIFNSMVGKDLDPDVISYCILIKGYCKKYDFQDAVHLCKNKHVKEALSILSEMKTKGDVRIPMYDILIGGFLNIRKIDAAKELFTEAISRGLKPVVRTYTVKELLREMEEAGCIPDSVTYNIIVHGLLKRNNYEEATKLLEEMIGRGFSPDSATVSLLIKLLPAKDHDSTLLDMIQKLGPKKEK